LLALCWHVSASCVCAGMLFAPLIIAPLLPETLHARLHNREQAFSLSSPLPLFYTSLVYELTVETVFSAAHSLLIQGKPEQLHGHDWHVTAAVVGPTLDPDGLLIDFHAVERALLEIVAPFRNANLNQTPPFDRVNPSAENVAAFLAHSLNDRVASLVGVSSSLDPTNIEHPSSFTSPRSHLPRVAWVRVTEAPGCAVKWSTDERVSP